MINETEKKLEQKISGQVSNFKFRVILGHISNFSSGRKFKYQNNALEVNFPKEVVARSPEGTRGQKFDDRSKFFMKR